jgi:hypothetical protein
MSAILPVQSSFSVEKAKIFESQSNSEIQFFKNEENIKTCLSLLRSDRIFNQKELTHFLVANLDREPKEIKDNPFLAMLWMTLENSGSLEDREYAEDLYIEKFGKEDSKFERGYSWTNDPHILMGHYLYSKNPKYDYNDEMAGLFAGTVSFDPGAVLTESEYLGIKEKQGWAPSEGEDAYLTKIAGASPLESPTYVVKKWLGTNKHSAIDHLFIPKANDKLNNAMKHVINGLEKTSALAQEKLGALSNSVLMVIGAPGAGKSSFIAHLLSPDSVVYSMDCIKDFFANKKQNATNIDYHFVSSKMRWSFINQAKNIPVIVAETPATDASLLSAVLRNYAGRENKFFYEIALLDPKEAVLRKLINKPEIDSGYLQKSAESAQTNRRDRIVTLLAIDKLVYALYTNEQSEKNNPNFVKVATIRDKKIEVVEGQEDIYALLTG